MKSQVFGNKKIQCGEMLLLHSPMSFSIICELVKKKQTKKKNKEICHNTSIIEKF